MHPIRRFLNTGYVAARAGIERHIPYWAPKRVSFLQGMRLRSIVRHAFETVPFYREYADKKGLRADQFRAVPDLEQLPLLDDLTVRRDPERFASGIVDAASRITIYTSGSTSHVQKKIYWDHSALIERLAYAERDRAVLASLLRGQSRRQLYILPPDSATLAVRNFWDAAVLTPSRIAERHFLPLAATMEEVRQTINRLRPSVVFSYGSYADQLFRWLADRGLELSAPKVWMYGADMLSERAREIMQERYGCIPYTTYQSGETGRIGFECELRRGFHLNEDFVAVRVIDGNGRNAPPGECGELVVSNLYNRAMVLLNLRIGDLGVISKSPCPCGRSLPLLEHFEGRRTDVVRLPDGRQFTAVMIELTFKGELKDTIQAQVVQYPNGGFCWRLVPCSNVKRSDLQSRVLGKSASVFGKDAGVTVDFVEHIPNARSGKFHKVVTEPAMISTDTSPAIIDRIMTKKSVRG
jgi:phenylacetate-CoA ligase